MSSEFLKQARFPIAMLFVVFLAASVVALRREQLNQDLERVEALMVAKVLIDLPGNAEPENVGYSDPNEHGEDYPSDQGEQHEWMEKEAIRKEVIQAIPKANAIEQSGQFIAAQHLYVPGKTLAPDQVSPWPWGFDYDVPMVGGGWLDVKTRQPTEKMFRERLEESEAQRKGWWEENEPLPPAPIGHRLFIVAAWLSELPGKPLPLAAKSARLVFTNIQDREDEALNSYSEPGEISAYYLLEGSESWVGPVSRAEIVAAILENSRKWGLTTASPDEAYLALRSKFERQETSLPVVSLSMASDSFLLCSFALSIGLAAWASFLLRGALREPPNDEKEPWVLFEPFRRIGEAARWDRIPAFLELALFSAFHMIALPAPLLVGGILLCWGSPNDRGLSIALLVPAAILSTSLVTKYVGLARKARRSATSANA